MKVILNGCHDIAGMASAAADAILLRKTEYPDSDLIGLRRNGRLYSVKFTSASVIVHPAEDGV